VNQLARMKTSSIMARIRFLSTMLRSLVDGVMTELRWYSRRKIDRRRRFEQGVVVCLTSYPARFKTLHLTVKTLLLQNVQPLAIVLWLADGDLVKLPANVLSLRAWGLEIRTCEDLRSYKKLIPAIDCYKDKVIVTADDDVVYWRAWLCDLLHHHVENTAEILCHRMHEITLNQQGLPRTYSNWRWCSENLTKHSLNFATGSGGILYPPGIFDIRVLDTAEMMTICPTGDDIWFYWMARMNGAKVRKVPSSGALRFWLGSQETALWKPNVEGSENDIQIRAMIEKFGFPN